MGNPVSLECDALAPAVIEAMRVGDFARAARVARVVLARTPASANWGATLASAELAAGHVTAAVAIAARVDLIDPDVVEPMLDHLLALALGLFRDPPPPRLLPTVARLTELLVRRPRFADAAEGLASAIGHLYDEASRVDDRALAEAVLRLVLRLRPGEAKALAGLARLRHLAGDDAQALEAARRALAAPATRAALSTFLRPMALDITLALQTRARALAAGDPPGAFLDLGAGYARLAEVVQAMEEDPAPHHHAAALCRAIAEALAAGASPPETVMRGVDMLERHTAVQAGRACSDQGRHDQALALLRRVVAARGDVEDIGVLSGALAAQALAGMFEALEWQASIAIGHRHLAEHAQAERDARQLITAIDAMVTAPHLSERARTDAWARARSADAQLVHAQALEALSGRPFAGAGRRRVFDCFTFFNELDLLELRLGEMARVVDRFVIVEAGFTHAGAPKPLHFALNRARFARWADKIIHVVVDDDPGGFAWRREAHQRDAIAGGLALGQPADHDLILVSDADEILRAETVARLAAEPAVDALLSPQLDLFYYFANLKAPEPWVSVAAGPHRLIQAIGANRARYAAKVGLGRAVPGAGWHFTWLGGAERYIEKVRSFAHEEGVDVFERDEAGHRAALARFFAGATASVIPGMRADLTPVALDAALPKALLAERQRYMALGWLLA